MLQGRAMVAFLTWLLLVAHSRLKSRAKLEGENLVLRSEAPRDYSCNYYCADKAQSAACLRYHLSPPGNADYGVPIPLTLTLTGLFVVANRQGAVEHCANSKVQMQGKSKVLRIARCRWHARTHFCDRLFARRASFGLLEKCE